MKTLVFILVFVLMASAPAYSADWHLDALDKFQTVRRIYEAKERDLLCQREPKLQDYYKLWDSLLEVSRRMDRRALVLKLEALPPDGGIVWDNPWEWGCPIESSEEEASLATKDGAFATLRTEKNRLRNDLKLLHDLMKLRQSVYEKLKVENVVNSQAMIEELTRIQKRIQANNNLSITFRMTKKGDLFLDIENKSDKEQVFKSNIIGVLDLKVFDFPTRGYLQFRTDKADILFLGNHEVPDWRSAGNYSSQPFPPAEGLKQISEIKIPAHGIQSFHIEYAKAIDITTVGYPNRDKLPKEFRIRLVINTMQHEKLTETEIISEWFSCEKLVSVRR